MMSSGPRSLTFPLAPGAIIGGTVSVYPVLGSTNDQAMDEIVSGGPDGLVVVADEQTAGRGRFSRAWRSTPGDDLMVSVGVRPPKKIAGILSILAGLAVARTVDRLTDETATIKWPNDVRVGGRKISGVLVESRHFGESSFAVIGIGLNLMLDPAEWDEISETATSIHRVTGRRVERDAVLGLLLAELDAVYRRAIAGEAVVHEWSGRLDTIGRRVELSVAPDGATFAGVATGIDSEGALIVRQDDGTTRSFDAAEVTSQTSGDSGD